MDVEQNSTDSVQVTLARCESFEIGFTALLSTRREKENKAYENPDYWRIWNIWR